MIPPLRRVVSLRTLVLRTLVLINLVAALMVATGNRSYGQEDIRTDQQSVTRDQALRLINQLDANKASDRSAAEKALIAAGPDVLDYLPESPVGFSIEAMERLDRVRQAVTAMKAKRQSEAIRIRLGGTKFLGEALEAISRESGIEFQHNADASLPIQASAAPLSFWNAVDLVLDQASLDINHYQGDRETIVLVPRNESRQSRVNAAAYSGVYRIEPLSVSARRVFNQPQQNGLNVSMDISWQPGITPIGLSIPVAELSGKLDDGQALQPQTTENTIDIPTNSELAFSEFFLPLQLPTGSPNKIESLRGTIESLLPGKQHNFELDLTDSGASKTVEAVTVRLERVQPNGDLYEIRFSVEIRNADRALESHRQWIFQNPVYVLDAQGNRVENLGYELFRKTESNVGLGYLFEIDRIEGAKLVYQTPTSVVKNTVNFVLHDIPLP